MEAINGKQLYSGLQKIRQQLEKSKLFPPSLSGACNVSSIITHSFLLKLGLDSEIVNNSKHCFCLISRGGIVIDLTATQISKSKFQDIHVNNYTETTHIAKRIIKGRGFYNLKDNHLFLRGSFEDVLAIRPEFKNDERDLFRLMKAVRTTLCNFDAVKPSIEEDIHHTLRLVDNFVETIVKDC